MWPHQLRHQRPYMMDSVFSVGKKEGCRMGVCSVFEFRKREEDGIWRSLFVKPNWSSAQPKSQSGVWLPGCSLSEAVECLLVLLGPEREARQGQCKGEQCQGSGLPFSPSQPSKPCSYAKKLLCVCCALHGQAQAVVTQGWVLLGNCLWGKNVYSPQLPNYAARWAEHVKWSTNQLCLFPAGAVISLVQRFVFAFAIPLFPLAYCFPWPDTWCKDLSLSA